MSECEMLPSRAAYALWASSYPATAHNPLMQAEERAMLCLLPSDLSGLQVLDVGCGSGRYLSHAARRGACKLIGVDLSADMLQRARQELQRPPCSNEAHGKPGIRLIEGSAARLPIRSRWADLILCALTLGHLPDLVVPLRELYRVTRPGATILCSDIHPSGEARGWKRTFKADGRRYAVEHTTHSYKVWKQACRLVGLRLQGIMEPYLDPADIPPDARFDPEVLRLPVVSVFSLQRPLETGS